MHDSSVSGVAAPGRIPGRIIWKVISEQFAAQPPPWKSQFSILLQLISNLFSSSYNNLWTIYKFVMNKCKCGNTESAYNIVSWFPCEQYSCKMAWNYPVFSTIYHRSHNFSLSLSHCLLHVVLHAMPFMTHHCHQGYYYHICQFSHYFSSVWSVVGPVALYDLDYTLTFAINIRCIEYYVDFYRLVVKTGV